MTVRSRTSKRDRDIRRMLLECYPIATIARIKGISETRVRQIRDRFVDTGDLVAVPHTRPTVYADPHSLEDAGLRENGGGAVKNGDILDSMPASGVLPEGMVNAHVNGRISLTVRRKGGFEDIRGPDGLYVGYWDPETSGGRGKIHRRAHIRLFKQDITVNFYESSKGTFECYVNPGRVYYYPAKVKRQAVLDYILERVLYVANLLRGSGWQLADPQLPRNYQLHRGKENDQLARMIPAGYHSEDSDIITDTSPGYPETEMEGASDEELVEIYANMPSAIKEVRGQVASGSAEIERMKADLDGLMQVVDMQSAVLGKLAGNVTVLAESITRFNSMEASDLAKRMPRFTGEGYL